MLGYDFVARKWNLPSFEPRLQMHGYSKLDFILCVERGVYADSGFAIIAGLGTSSGAGGRCGANEAAPSQSALSTDDTYVCHNCRD